MTTMVNHPASAAAPVNALLTGPILPTLIRLALPNLAAMLTAALVAIAETVYIGVLGTAPLAAMALVFPMVMLTQMMSAGAMGGGVSSAISRALGAGDHTRAETLAFHAAVIGAAAGIAFTLFFLVLGRPIYSLLGGRDAVLEQAMIYSNTVFSGAIATWLTNSLASVVRGTGNMRLPSATLLVVSVLQIVLGGSLGLGIGPIPRFGLVGVALGQVVAYAAGALFLAWYLCAGHGRLTLRFAGATFRRDMFFDILRVGAIAVFSPLQSVMTVLVLTGLVARFGTEVLAGYGIGARLEFLLVPIVFGIGVACVPMVGMAIGAGDVVRARRVAWIGAGVAAAILAAIGLVVAIVPDLWSGLFSADAGVRAAANLYLRWAGPGFAFFGLGMALYFASQGAGKVLGPVLTASLRLLLIVVGGWWLATSDAPPWSMFALVSVAMAVYGLATAAAIHATAWE